MGIYHGNDLRKISGGLKSRHVKVKRKYLTGRYPLNPTVGNRTEVKVIRARGGNYKVRVKVAAEANVYIPSQKKTIRVKILKVLDNPSNRNLARRGVITRGAVIQTEAGKAVVTSRPGQDGVVNAVLVESS
ncbi:MAG: 30S ribosomal protein S8e [Infirmifilum sp.]|jgi:small subunit ribosomal protein S8e|uniref:Small ribosomal subunit protein eS8 n=1 Tax=Infirmifilum uzonense TaxID=1550241 RepID=A0A0F7FJU9_9CREN|nr:30S ribosomal protein S8e [Infirmifilum uzonense]AKG39207.1 30S ribosomal protein S8e [Infirmifilum uzonense]